MSEFSDAVLGAVPNPPGPFFMARWVSAEAVDGNLSIIETPFINGLTGSAHIRFVPKLSSVSGLAAGKTVLCSLQPCVIIGIVVGDITKAS